MKLISHIIPTADTYIDSQCPYNNFSNLIIAWLGTKNCHTEYRYLLRFNFDCIPAGAEIISCRLKLYVDQAQNKTFMGSFTPYMIATDWNYRTVTWDTQPQLCQQIHAKSVSISDKGWYQWDITNIFNKWFSGTFYNFGILIRDDGVKDHDAKRIISSRNHKSNYIYCRPCIVIQYLLPQCTEDVFIKGRQFKELSFEVATDDEYKHTLAFNTSQQSNTTMFLKNIGLSPTISFVEVSPNDVDYIADGPEFEIQPGEMIALVPRHFSKYAHIAYKSKETNESTQLEITIQAQV